MTFKCFFWLFFVVFGFVGLVHVCCSNGKLIIVLVGIRGIVGEWVDGGSGLCSFQG